MKFGATFLNLSSINYFIYIPHAMAVFLIPYLSTAIPIQFIGTLYYSIVYSVVIVAIRRSLFVLARMTDIPALSVAILAQAIQADIREYQSLISCIRQKLCRGVRTDGSVIVSPFSFFLSARTPTGPSDTDTDGSFPSKSIVYQKPLLHKSRSFSSTDKSLTVNLFIFFLSTNY